MSCQTDLAAFEAFAAAERGKALKYTTAWVGPETAQDVVQDALLVVWKKWDTLTQPAGYLYRTCRQLAFGEYEDRSRGPVLLAELPQRTHLDDEDQDEPPMGAAMLTLAVELMDQNWSFPYTPGVGMNLAEGLSRAETAERMGVPLAEVHRSARELRRYYKAHRDNAEPTAPQNAYTPHGLVTRAMRQLSRREREVMALAAIGLKPQLIGPLIGISGGSARTTLCHARKAVADTVGLVTDKCTPYAVDQFVRDTLSAAELLNVLPNTSWRAETFRRAAAADELGRSGSLLDELVKDSPVGIAIKMADDYARARRQMSARLGEINSVSAGTRQQNEIVRYLTQMSKVFTVVQAGLETPAPASYGSVRWLPFGVRFRAAFVGAPLVPAAAYRRLQATDNPAMWSGRALRGHEGGPATVGVPDFSCAIPSWPARPPRYLVPAPYPREGRFSSAVSISFSKPHSKSSRKQFEKWLQSAQVRSVFATAA